MDVGPTRSQSQPQLEGDDHEISCLRQRRSLSATSYEETFTNRILEILKGQVTLTKIKEAERLLKHIEPLEKKMDGSELGTSLSSYSFQTTDYHGIALKAIEAARQALVSQKFLSDKP